MDKIRIRYACGGERSALTMTAGSLVLSVGNDASVTNPTTVGPPSWQGNGSTDYLLSSRFVVYFIPHPLIRLWCTIRAGSR